MYPSFIVADWKIRNEIDPFSIFLRKEEKYMYIDLSVNNFYPVSNLII